MPSPVLPLDTPPQIERRQIASWRQMSSVQKAATISGLTQAALAMTWAGVRQRHPQATRQEHFHHVAIIVLGPDLASAAYPDAARLIGR